MVITFRFKSHELWKVIRDHCFVFHLPWGLSLIIDRQKSSGLGFGGWGWRWTVQSCF